MPEAELNSSDSEDAEITEEDCRIFVSIIKPLKNCRTERRSGLDPPRARYGSSLIQQQQRLLQLTPPVKGISQAAPTSLKSPASTCRCSRKISAS
ncbi:hypothetical protein MHYP_G00251570 [Metynnis hypsauchen]